MGMIEGTATVSVVIPTRNRPEQVQIAVASALAQTQPPLEVIVVIDGPDEPTAEALASLADPRLVVHQNPVPLRAGGARRVGIELARGDYVALLDDDDTWRPTKLERQLAWFAARPTEAPPAVLGTRAMWHDGAANPVWPLRAPRADETVGHYLFVRKAPGEGALPTPTLMLPRELAQSVPFPTHLRTHEEWDWMLDLEKAGARFDVLLETLVDVDATPRRSSVSSQSHWRASAAWALTRADDLGPDTFAAFMLTETARSASLGKAPARDHLAIATLAASGRPSPRDLARFIGRPLALALRNRARSGQ